MVEPNGVTRPTQSALARRLAVSALCCLDPTIDPRSLMVAKTGSGAPVWDGVVGRDYGLSLSHTNRFAASVVWRRPV